MHTLTVDSSTAVVPAVPLGVLLAVPLGVPVAVAVVVGLVPQVVVVVQVADRGSNNPAVCSILPRLGCNQAGLPDLQVDQ